MVLAAFLFFGKNKRKVEELRWEEKQSAAPAALVAR